MAGPRASASMARRRQVAQQFEQFLGNILIGSAAIIAAELLLQPRVERLSVALGALRNEPV